LDYTLTIIYLHVMQELLYILFVRSQCLLQCSWIWTIFLHPLSSWNGFRWYLSFTANPWGIWFSMWILFYFFWFL